MRVEDAAAVITGGGSGLGLATAALLVERGAYVTVLDRAAEAASAVAGLGPTASFVRGDVTDPDDVRAAADAAASRGPLRVAVHCAGIGSSERVLDRSGRAASLEAFSRVVGVSLVGAFNTLTICAERMAGTDAVEGERGVAVLTSSIAAFDGQIGQLAYSAAKAGLVGMTLPAARDLAAHLIRVVTVAPGSFDTPILKTVREDIRQRLADAVPHPSRLGHPEEFASFVGHVIDNPMLNGETVRLDGALRMAPR